MTDPHTWVQTHKVCWEIEPLREPVKGHGTQQTGYELRLFGRLDLRTEEDTDRAVLRVHDGLRQLVRDLFALLEPHAVVEVRPFDRAVHLRSESGFAVEVQLVVVAYPAHPDHPMPAAEAQRHIAAVEEKLRGMGLHRCPLANLRDFANSHTRFRA